MNRAQPLFHSVIVGVFLLLGAVSAHAADNTQLSVDVEVDPIAYLARGHSLHVGLRAWRLRFDLGAFGLTVPEFIHGQDDFENAGSGYGTKLDLYLLKPQTGPFVGVEGGYMRQQIVDERSDTRAIASSFTAGGRVGWQIDVTEQFFVKPWVGIGYRFGNDSVHVAGRTFEQSPLLIFPTLHVGYTFF